MNRLMTILIFVEAAYFDSWRFFVLSGRQKLLGIIGICLLNFRNLAHEQPEF